MSNNAVNLQKFFAVRVVVQDTETGEAVERDYVRREKRMGKRDWVAFALGDLMYESGYHNATWSVREVTFDEVAAARMARRLQ